MIIFEAIKNIRKCKSITREEQNWLIKNGILEIILGFYKILLNLPILIISYIFLFLAKALEWMSDFFYYYIYEPLENLTYKIKKLPPTSLTQGKIRDTAFQELKENKFYKNK